jgi:hypothetical protein
MIRIENLVYTCADVIILLRLNYRPVVLSQYWKKIINDAISVIARG